MRALISLMLMGSLIAQNSMKESQQFPQPIVPFELSYNDVFSVNENPIGKINVVFFIDENGDVEDAVIIDSFDVKMNSVVLDKVKQTKYQPAIQNGRPVKVKYHLPIVFK